AFGRDVAVHYRFDRANVILSLDADFLSCGPGHLRYVRDFSSRRQVRQPRQGEPPPPPMSRLYVVESTLTTTGAKADHRRALRAQQVESCARAVAGRLRGGVEAGTGPAHEVPAGWIDALVQDLQLRANHGASIILAGDGQPPIVHALAFAMNEALGNLGNTVVVTEPVEVRPEWQSSASPSMQSLYELLRDMPDPGESNRPSRIDILLILGGNPVYTTPANDRFKERMEGIPLRIHLNLYEDETSEQCHWHIPEAHYLESWGDVRAYDGTASIIQPLIAPLYRGRSAVELLAALTGESERSGYEIVRDSWRQRRMGKGTDFEKAWERALPDGVIAGSAFEPKEAPAPGEGWAEGLRASPPAPDELEIVFRPDPTIHDGRFANNGWLQELPKP